MSEIETMPITERNEVLISDINLCDKIEGDLV